jgi:hypothetical protein
MDGSNFDLLVQEVLKQQNMMEELEKENRELRRQLADLRTGRGIFINICGKNFTFGDESTENTPTAAAAAKAQAADEAGPAEEIEAPVPPERASAAEPATATETGEPAEVVAAALPDEQQAQAVAAASAAQASEQESEVAAAPIAQVAEPKPEAVAAAPAIQAAGSATFLEEIMIDEFAVAATKPMSVWNGPVNPAPKREDIDEEQKARLRRELTGSFLLE